MYNNAQKFRLKTKGRSFCFWIFLKLYKEVACFDLADRPFHGLAALLEKNIWPLVDFLSVTSSQSPKQRLYDELSLNCIPRQFSKEFVQWS